MAPALALAAAYLLGSIPFSFLVARAFGVEDVRRVGSGNVGATNVLRSAGKAAGVLALLLDAAKGAAATWLATWLAPEPSVVAALAAPTVVVGHMYPVWLRFQGGKGVATGLGAFAPLLPKAALVATILFLLTLAATRYVSLSSLVGAVSLAALAFVFGGSISVAWAATFTAGLVVLRHRSNLRRLWGGAERRAGEPGR
ncbi:MAG: glycerol-3-phosphate 1-O-acyltransferase PlsY [Acidobacteriota bacterium]|jgi:glycerol-3-phosphate acyltransferase PlsY